MRWEGVVVVGYAQGTVIIKWWLYTNYYGSLCTWRVQAPPGIVVYSQVSVNAYYIDN